MTGTYPTVKMTLKINDISLDDFARKHEPTSTGCGYGGVCAICYHKLNLFIHEVFNKIKKTP